MLGVSAGHCRRSGHAEACKLPRVFIKNDPYRGTRKAAGKCRDKRLVGIVSFGDVALYGDSQQADTAVAAVSEPGGPHTQSGGTEVRAGQGTMA
jgi:hypothetical protein